MYKLYKNKLNKLDSEITDCKNDPSLTMLGK